MTENELVGLFNLFNRISNSIKWYGEYCADEDIEYHRKSIIYFVLLGLIGLLFILALVLLVAKDKKTEESEPLRTNQQPS